MNNSHFKAQNATNIHAYSLRFNGNHSSSAKINKLPGQSIITVVIKVIYIASLLLSASTKMNNYLNIHNFNIK